MKNTKKVKLAGIITLLLSLMSILYFVKTGTGKKMDKKAATKYNLASKAKYTPVGNLYHLNHPYLLKGDALNAAKKYDSAICCYKEASIEFEKEKNWGNYVYINGYIARLYLYVSGMNYKQALPYLQKAFEKSKQHLGINHPYMATTCYYLGLYYLKSNQADSSLQMLNKALDILFQHYKSDNIYTADVYNILGEVYANLIFDNASAEKYYLKSVKIKEALPGKEEKSNLTNSYYNLVAINISIGEYEKAQTYCNEAIRNVTYLKYHIHDWSELLEDVLGNIYIDQKMFDKAMLKLRNAIRINKEYNLDKSYLPYGTTCLGDIHSRLGRYDSAIACYKMALRLTKTYSIFTDQQQQAATTMYSLGMTYLKTRNYHNARFYLNKCLHARLGIHAKKNWETAIAFQGMGSIFKAEGMADSALRYFQLALMECTKNLAETSVFTVPSASEINNNIHSYQIIRDKACVLKELFDGHPSDSRLLYASFAYYCLADTLMTLFRSGYDRETAKLVFSNDNNNIYEEAIDCAALLYQKTKENRYLDMAFNIMDKRKSGLLIDALHEKELFVQAGIPLKEQHLLGSLQLELAFLQNQLDLEKSKQPAEELVLQALYARINLTKQKFDTLHEKLGKRYPFYASIQHKNDTVTIKDLQAYSHKTNSLVLEYFWGEKAVYALGHYKYETRLLKINRSNELNRYVDTLRANLDNGYVITSDENDFRTFQESAYQIYHSLVEPMLASFNVKIKAYKAKPGITVIPDGPLSYIPFEALVTSSAVEKEVDYQKLPYLINDYVVRYNYSSQLLLKNYTRPFTRSDPAVLALSYSEDQVSKNQAGKLKQLKKNDMADLPGSARELMAISTYMKGQFYMGNEATESIFKKEAPGYDILHLAVHGEADSLHSYNSRLILKKGNDRMNDGTLYAYEMYNLPLKARLAVLSACESGIGKMNPGEGMYSMGRGFMYAGCPSLVISFWRINDNATQVIVLNFYKQISAGDNIDQSLRKAKLEYLRNANRRTAHPSNWAAFVAMGDMTPLVEQSSHDKPIRVVFLILLIGLNVYLIRRNYTIKTLI